MVQVCDLDLPWLQFATAVRRKPQTTLADTPPLKGAGAKGGVYTCRFIEACRVIVFNLDLP
ncbi:hypothetical protein DC20_07290 [Rufibacter tibetensis]|uniref:Uncharacterized protein n=1 Tax=Rufibacter tibetensis TaxID=512763 RepID=A0A0P0C1M7_9BACT|nr:hypothetical protein DC20_07290 [Rufibacter tibetensis]